MTPDEADAAVAIAKTFIAANYGGKIDAEERYGHLSLAGPWPERIYSGGGSTFQVIVSDSLDETVAEIPTACAKIARACGLPAVQQREQSVT